MLRPPGYNTPSTSRGDDRCSDVMHVLCVSKHGRPLRVFFWGGPRRIACNSGQLGRGLKAWANTAGNANGGVEAWYMAPKILLGVCMGASSKSLFHNNCCAVFQASINLQSIIQRSIQKNGVSTEIYLLYGELCFVAVRCCLLFAVCLVRAGCPEWSGSRVRNIVCPFTPQYVYLLVKKRQLCCCASRCRT